jgi:hypothetical protein
MIASVSKLPQNLYPTPIMLRKSWFVRWAVPFVLGVLTVQAQDKTPPRIISTASLDGQTIGVRFDKPVDPASAQDAGNYRLKTGAVTSARLRSDGISVELMVKGLTESNYTLKVAGVLDRFTNAANSSATGIVLGLTAEDFGSPLQTGSAFCSAPGSIQVQAGGFDAWFNHDSFHFIHQKRIGDFDVRVQVTEFGPVGAQENAKALLMVRDGTNVGSRDVAVTVYPRQKNWVAFARSAVNGPSAVINGNWNVAWPAGTVYPNAWLRLRRIGNTFTAFGSTNGTVWNQVGDVVIPTPPYPATVSLGLGTTSTGDQFPGSPMVNVSYENFGDIEVIDPVIIFTQHPSDVTVRASTPATFHAAVSVSEAFATNLVYQWQLGAADIAGANSPNYTIPLASLSQDGTRYRLKAFLPGAAVAFSRDAGLHVISHDETPAIVPLEGPLNVMVGGLTFTRPPAWKWAPLPDNESAQVCFDVPTANENDPTDVLFYPINKDAKEMEKAWKASFPEADEPGNSSEDRVKIGPSEIVYLTWRGVYQLPNSKSRPKRGNKFVLAVVPGPKTYVQVRLYGPEADVDKALNNFKKMVEGSLRGE